jgi:hypothetical protein
MRVRKVKRGNGTKLSILCQALHFWDRVSVWFCVRNLERVIADY